MKGDEAAKEKGVKIFIGSVVFILMLAFAESLVAFITGTTFAPPSDFPAGLKNMIDNLIATIKWGGSILAAIGLIYGGYQYVKRTARP
jgi:hypothetical protein